MHVAVVGELPADRRRPKGGVPVVTANLIRALVNSGVEVTAVEWRSSRADAFNDDYLGCRAIPLQFRRPAIVMNWLWTSRELNAIIGDVQPDLVHVIGVPELGWSLKHARVLSLHGIAPRDEWLRDKRRRYLTTPLMAATFWLGIRKFEHVIVLNSGALEFTGPMRHARCHVIENAVEEPFFHITRQASGPTVLFVGALCALKNTLGLVRTAAEVRKVVPEVRFRLVGPWTQRDDPAYRQAVERFCKDQDLRQTVEFVGLLSREEVMAELARAACLVLPSFQEVAPAVIGEAMAAGVPVAASRLPGIAHMVDEGKTGLLFDPHDVPEIARCLTRLLTDPALLERMGQESRRVVVDRHHPEAVARRHLAVYQQVLDDWGR